MDAVKHWEFQPFEADGQPAEAITFVKVGFASTRRQETEADATMQALSDYWMALDLANKSLVQKDLRGATQRLEIAERLFVANRWRSDTIEQAEWLRASASLATDQGNLPDAEDKYSRALKIFKQIDKGSLATARTLALLGEVYLHEGKYNPARDTFGKAVKLYVELFNESDDRDSASRKTCGASIASISLLLSKAAAQQKDNAELNKNCQVVVKFREYLGEADRQSLTSTCQQDAAN